jgi:Flp pilus assembly protein CpaB
MPLIRRYASVGARGGLLSTRRGTVAVAVGVALLAAAILVTFLNHYRTSIAGEGEPARVLVANGLIAKGSSAQVLTSEKMVRTVRVRKSQLAEGAVSDPATIRGQVAVEEILAGQQLNASDFTPARDPVAIKLGAADRAIAVPVDAVHGLAGPVQAGDHVDVLVGFNGESSGGGAAGAGMNVPVVKKILDDVLVLRASGASEQAKGNVVLRVPARLVSHVAYAADNGLLWLTLRPAAGAREARSEVVTLEKVLVRAKPVPLNRNGGKR